MRIELEVLERSVESTGQTSAICDSLIRHYLCNYVYPPCDAREHPIGICQEDCELFTSHRGECSFEINFLLGLDVNNLRNLEACNDTLRHLEVVSQGNNISRSSQCLEVAGKVMTYDFVGTQSGIYPFTFDNHVPVECTDSIGLIRVCYSQVD